MIANVSQMKTGTDKTAKGNGAAVTAAIQARVERVDWERIYADLDAQGWAIAPKILTHAEADAIAGLYHQGDGFRSHVIMGRHGFRVGQNLRRDGPALGVEIGVDPLP